MLVGSGREEEKEKVLLGNWSFGIDLEDAVTGVFGFSEAAVLFVTVEGFPGSDLYSCICSLLLVLIVSRSLVVFEVFVACEVVLKFEFVFWVQFSCPSAAMDCWWLYNLRI
ncbi:hypothetical protein Droror1_Dr00016084 [Drosera rotundifolia]